jgi:PKD repeat protein
VLVASLFLSFFSIPFPARAWDDSGEGIISVSPPDYLRIAQDNKLEGENAWLWQTITYKGTKYSVFIYSKSAISEFSIQDQYIDEPITGPMRIQATTAQGQEWVNVEGIIVVDGNGNITKNDEISKAVLTLAEAQGYYRYVKQNDLKREDFDSFYENIENTVNGVYWNPAIWPTLLIYRQLPTPYYNMQLYEELLTSVFVKNPVDKTTGTGSAKDDINKYISIATDLIDNTQEYLELRYYKQFLSQSAELQKIASQSDYLSKFDRNIKDLFDKLETYKLGALDFSTGRYFVKFLVGLAFAKTAGDEYLPYLKALRDYIATNPRLSYDNEWSSLLGALNEVINMADGTNSLLYKMLYGFFDVAIEYFWDRVKEEIVNGLQAKIGELALQHGLTFSQIGSYATSICVGVGLGIVFGDMLFDMSSFYRNLDLMVKARKLDTILKESYDKVSSIDITSLEANIETRRLQFSLLEKTWQMLAENADGGGAREALNSFRDFVGKLLGYQFQSTEEYINTIRKIWIPYYSFMESLAVPPLHCVEIQEPKWQPFQYLTSSTAAVNNMMYIRRGLNDPSLMTSLELDQYWFSVGDIGKVKVILMNPSDTPISDIWINATLDPRTNLTPPDVHLDSLQAHQDVNASFLFSFNRPGVHALSFWINAENGTYVYFESVSVEAYLAGLNVTMKPSTLLLGDNVDVTVTDSSGYSLSNATVAIQNPTELQTLTTGSSGTANFTATMIGLWFICVTYPNEPMYGPNSFIVRSMNSDTFGLEMNDVNASRISPNRTYCRGFRLLNNGVNDLQLQARLVGNASWLTSCVSTVVSGELCFENATVLNNSLAMVDLPSGHWTAGYVLFSACANATIGLQTALTLNVSVVGSSLLKEESFTVTVDTGQLSISFNQAQVVYSGDNFTANIEVSDSYGNLTDPNQIAARIDNRNITSGILKMGLGSYNITVPNAESGDHILEISLWKDGFDNKSVSIPITILDRQLDFQFTRVQTDFSLNQRIELIDTISHMNVIGADVFVVLSDRGGDKATLILIETIPGVYENNLNLASYAVGTNLSLTVCTSKAGYAPKICSYDVVVSAHTPIAEFGYSPNSPTVYDIISFIDQSSDPNGYVVTWVWDFGDGTNSTLQTPTHRFDQKGAHAVKLTVIDNDGARNSTIHTVVIANLPPKASFHFAPESPYTGIAIQFTDNSTDPENMSILSYDWDFGDDHESRLRNPVNSFLSAGNYNVSLTVSDDENATNTFSMMVSVAQSPAPVSLWQTTLAVLAAVATTAIIVYALKRRRAASRALSI